MKEYKQLSLCVITKNDEKYISNCLENMKQVVDELLVFDIGSTDKTIEIAKRSGATIYQPKWENNFSKIKNFCMEKATGKWVLFLWANEMISSEQFKELKILLKNPCAEAYLFDINLRENDCEFSSPTELLRLLRNRKKYSFKYRSFEYIPEEELFSIQRSDLIITRFGEKDIDWQKEKLTLLKLDNEEFKEDTYINYLQGLKLMNERNFEESARYFNLSLENVNGGYLYVEYLYKCLGICLLILKDYISAEKILTQGVKLFPHYNDLLILRAKVFNKLNRNQEALQDIKTCMFLRDHNNRDLLKSQIENSVIEEMQIEIRALMYEENF